MVRRLLLACARRTHAISRQAHAPRITAALLGGADLSHRSRDGWVARPVEDSVQRVRANQYVRPLDGGRNPLLFGMFNNLGIDLKDAKFEKVDDQSTNIQGPMPVVAGLTIRSAKACNLDIDAIEIDIRG